MNRAAAAVTLIVVVAVAAGLLGAGAGVRRAAAEAPSPGASARTGVRPAAPATSSRGAPPPSASARRSTALEARRGDATGASRPGSERRVPAPEPIAAAPSRSTTGPGAPAPDPSSGDGSGPAFGAHPDAPPRGTPRAGEAADDGRRTPWPQPSLGPSASGGPELLFTFDDGPEERSTSAVLDVLAQYRVHGVFFVVGRRLAKPRARDRVARMLREIVVRGHAVGNHTLTHPDLCLRANNETAGHEIDENQRLLEAATGQPVRLFRAPYGVRCEHLEALLAERRLRHLHWDLDAQEWRTHDPQLIFEYLVEKLAAMADGERAVVLAHDTYPVTAQVLPLLFDWIRAQNERRRATGRPPYRILGPADVARDRMAPAVLPLIHEATGGLQRAIPEVARRLLGPLAGVPRPREARL